MGGQTLKEHHRQTEEISPGALAAGLAAAPISPCLI
jgi:hypothetical protein